MSNIIMKPIEGFPGRYITTDGRLYSDLIHPNPRVAPLRELSRWTRNGYWAVSLYNHGTYPRTYKRYVHRLVLETFVGICPKGFQCRHLNGNPKDNRLENLAWGSVKENQFDRIAHRTDCRGSKQPTSKLNEHQVKEIYFLTKDNRHNDTYRMVGKRFGVALTTIGQIARGEKWKHVIQSI